MGDGGIYIISFVLIFVSLTLVFVVSNVSKKDKKDPKKRKKIYAYISNAHANGNTEIHIDKICTSLQLEYLETIKELEDMTPGSKDSSYYSILYNSFIDLNRKLLILTPTPAPPPKPEIDNSVASQLKGITDGVSEKFLGRKFFGSKETPQIIVEQQKVPSPVNCSGCGAKNPAPKNHSSTCEYCGAPL